MVKRDADIRIKRVYDPPDEVDGTQVLVDRLWPRGLRKVRPPSKATCTGLPATAGKPGKIPYSHPWRARTLLASVDPASATKSYTKPAAYVAPASPSIVPNGLFRLMSVMSRPRQVGRSSRVTTPRLRLRSKLGTDPVRNPSQPATILVMPTRRPLTSARKTRASPGFSAPAKRLLPSEPPAMSAYRGRHDGRPRTDQRQI
jgi:hypothetical protein